MKKIFVLVLLVMPFVAHATDPVGPSAVPSGGTAVVATASAPYATATAETGDTTNVVSASYVKGAYNDAIAAVNKVNADKQGKLTINRGHENISSDVVEEDDIAEWVFEGVVPSNMRTRLITASGANLLAKKVAVKDYNVNAVATWGSDTVTELHLKGNKSN